MDTDHEYHDISVVDNKSFPYIYEQNVSIPLQILGTGERGSFVRCNIFRPRPRSCNVDSEVARHPVIVTYGPYGKDIPYKE